MSEARPQANRREDGALYKGEAILRATRALSCFSVERPRWTTIELSARIGIPRDTLQGILNTLTTHGMLRRDADGAYVLGFVWLRFGALRRNQSDARSVALPLMREIRDAINETVALSLRVGDQRVHIEYVESTHPVRRLAQVGSSGPLHMGATGLSLLSTLPAGELAAYLGRVNSTVSPASYKRIERDLASVRKEGYAIAIGSVNADMAAVAAAARLYSDESVALTISCPLERFTPEMRRSCAELAKHAISKLSSKLGAKL